LEKIFTRRYPSPLGEIFLASDGDALTGLWFDGQRFFPKETFEENCPKEIAPRERQIFSETKLWLDTFFNGNAPNFTPHLNLRGTNFQCAAWEILLKIPFGKTTTYGNVAKILAAQNSGAKVSARAVGNAVGRNPISIIVPCHRVIGANASLGGYAAGLDKKIALLTLEKNAQ